MPDEELQSSDDLQAALETVRREVMAEISDRVEIVSADHLMRGSGTVMPLVFETRTSPEVVAAIEQSQLIKPWPAINPETISRLQTLALSETRIPVSTPERQFIQLSTGEVGAPRAHQLAMSLQPRFRSPEFGYLTDVRVPGIGRVLEGQVAPVTLGSKPGESPRAPAAAEVTDVDGNTVLEGLKAGSPETIKCGDHLLIRTRKPFACDVVVLEDFACSDDAAPPYTCDADAQDASDRYMPDRIGMDADSWNPVVRKIESGNPITDREHAMLKAWLGACKCVEDDVMRERGVMKGKDGKPVKDKDGKSMPDIPTRLRGEFDCEAPCVEVWEHWCGFARFEETERWCELVPPSVQFDPDCLPRWEYKHKYVIKVRIVGYFDLFWRVTCMKPEDFADTKLGKEEIASGNLPPDGRARGHYLPPGTDPARLPPGVESVPDGCCCEIVAIRPRPIETIIAENVFWGHRFLIDVDYRYRRLEPGESGRDCSLKWWEFTDSPPPDFETRYRIEPNKWANMCERIPASGVFRDWLTRSKSCDGVIRTETLVDEPGLSWPPRFPGIGALQIKRNLWIKIELTSGCPPYTTHSLCFYQHLDSTNVNNLYGWASMLTPNNCDALDPGAEERNPAQDATPPTPNHDSNNPPNDASYPR